MKMNFKKFAQFLFLFALASCSQYTPPVGVKIGQPYEVNGQTYYPEPDETYDKTGLASWYGPGFHGGKTASGERFNENDITAAHPTLPMPSLVRVTNLKNGESIITRVNDRGPFHSRRIIDLSKKTAQLIGLKSTQDVRVQYLKKETDDFMAAFRAGQTAKLDMAEINRLDKEKPESEMQIAEDNTPQEAAYDDNINVEAVASSPVQSIQTSDLAAPTADGKVEQNIMPLKPEENSLKNSSNKKTIALTSNTKTAENILKLPEKNSKNDSQKVPAPSIAQSSSGKYIVLAGSFSVEDNAKKLAKKIAASGKVLITKIASKGKNMWRVEVGGFADKSKAQKALDIIHKLGANDAKILSK
jgi:rare lipoprotein A